MIYLLHKTRIFFAIIFLMLSTVLQAVDLNQPLFEQEAVPSLVQDYANFLSPSQRQELEQQLNQLSNTTSTQILFVTVPSLLGYDKNDYAAQLGEAWGVGGKEDNGIVFLIQPKTNHTRGEVSIQVGYGIEPLIPDAVAKRIIEYEVIPAFKKGDNFAGVLAAVQVMTKLTQGQFTANQYLKKHQKKGQAFSAMFVMLFLAMMFFLRMRSARSHTIGGSLPFWMLLGMMGSSSLSGGFSDFSSGGGGFGGGFGGFGGGSFGGGGAGGSW